MLAALIMLAAPVAATLVASPAFAQAVSSIQVEGNRRVEVETIRAYFKPGPGGRLDQARIDDGLKALIETGLFQDVRISQPGGRLVVTVVENPVIGRIAFEGNKKVKDEQLSAEIQSKPRGTLSRPMVQSDAQRIAEIYRRPAVMTSASTPKSSSSRTTASISFSRSPRARKPASNQSSSSATAPIRRIVSRISSRRMNRIC
jgi:outer membrane protein insertion porin family